MLQSSIPQLGFKKKTKNTKINDVKKEFISGKPVKDIPM